MTSYDIIESRVIRNVMMIIIHYNVDFMQWYIFFLENAESNIKVPTLVPTLVSEATMVEKYEEKK